MHDEEIFEAKREQLMFSHNLEQIKENNRQAYRQRKLTREYAKKPVEELETLLNTDVTDEQWTAIKRAIDRKRKQDNG